MNQIVAYFKALDGVRELQGPLPKTVLCFPYAGHVLQNAPFLISEHQMSKKMHVTWAYVWFKNFTARGPS